jgi:hypothetical protein
MQIQLDSVKMKMQLRLNDVSQPFPAANVQIYSK